MYTGVNSLATSLTIAQTLESDRYICIRDKSGAEDKTEVIIVDLHKNNEVSKRPIKADSAIMHWSREIIALKAQRTLQIFNLEAKAKIKSHAMHEDVMFWKWISDTSLGMVTETSVYHWDVMDPAQAAPVKVFERHANLSVCVSKSRNGVIHLS